MRKGIIRIFVVAIIVLNLPHSGSIGIRSSDAHGRADNLFLGNTYCCNIMRLIPQSAFGGTLADGEKRDSKMMRETEALKGNTEDSYRGVMIKIALIVIFIWVILGVYLFTVERRIARLEKMIDEL